MIYHLFEAMAWGLSCGIVAGVYKHILPYEPYFTKWWQFGARYEGRWFFKPVWGCAHCFAGQLALWSFLGLRILPPAINAVRHFSSLPGFWGHCTWAAGMGLFRLIITISAGILTAKVLAWHLQKIS